MRSLAAWCGPVVRTWAALMLAVCLMLTGLSALAQGLAHVPALTGRVVDLTQTLSDAQRQALVAKLSDFEKERGTQIVLLMVPSTAPEDIAAYAYRVADSWKVGRREVGDGLLLVIAKNDRRMRVEVSRALEGAVPDLAAMQVIDQYLAPHFKRGDFAGGIDAGLDRLFVLVRNEGLPPGEEAQPDTGEISWHGLLGLMLFLGGLFVVAFIRLSGPVVGSFLGATLSGIGVFGAAVGWLVGHNPSWALLGYGLALVAAFVAFVMAGMKSGVPAVVVGSGTAGSGGRDTDHWSSSSSSDSWSSSSSDSFSSGGGGSYGGGGASGGW